MWNAWARALLALGSSRVAASVLAASIVSMRLTPSAAAAQSMPVTDWSFYVTTPDTGVAYNLGCNQGAFDASFSPVANSLVVLDFGGQFPDGSGSLLINGIRVSNIQIEDVVEAFAAGYWVCTGSDTTSVMMLRVGTNNSYYDVNFSGGSTWGQVVSDIIASNQANGYDAQVSVGGANDIEPSWDTAANTKAWVTATRPSTPRGM
jgi:hypothetical protein